MTSSISNSVNPGGDTRQVCCGQAILGIGPRRRIGRFRGADQSPERADDGEDFGCYRDHII